MGKKKGILGMPFEKQRKTSILTFAVLWSLSRLVTAVFLTLYGSCITSQVAFFLEGWSAFSVELNQSARDTVTNGTGLTGLATALDVYDDVKFGVSIENIEWLTDNHLEGIAVEVNFVWLAVDGEISGAWLEINSGYGCLSSADSVNSCGLHLCILKN
jgi:hypothetical protein